jgi:hypothetical protein
MVVAGGLLWMAVSSDSRCGGVCVRECDGYGAGSAGGSGGRKKTKAGRVNTHPLGRIYMSSAMDACCGFTATTDLPQQLCATYFARQSCRILLQWL